jgi:hypothetical protein
MTGRDDELARANAEFDMDATQARDLARRLDAIMDAPLFGGSLRGEEPLPPVPAAFAAPAAPEENADDHA